MLHFEVWRPVSGKVQRGIFNILNTEKPKMFGMKILATKVYHPGQYSENHYSYTKNEYRSIIRAVSNLEKKGLVRTMLVPFSLAGRCRLHKVVGLEKREIGYYIEKIRLAANGGLCVLQ